MCTILNIELKHIIGTHKYKNLYCRKTQTSGYCENSNNYGYYVSLYYIIIASRRYISVEMSITYYIVFIFSSICMYIL